MAEYEFSHVGKAEKVKIIIAKIVLGLFMAFEFHSLAYGGGDLGSCLSDIAGILILTFAYINVLNVKSELSQLFEPPFLNHGIEFFVGFLILILISWVV
jgi:hypothetical protein